MEYLHDPEMSKITDWAETAGSIVTMTHALRLLQQHVHVH